MRKSGSYLSMENLDIEEEDEGEDESPTMISVKKKDSKKNIDIPKLDSENVVLHPIYILE